MKRALPGIAAALLLAACSSGVASGVPGALTSVAASGQCHVRMYKGYPLPDPRCSPGAVQPGYTIADICPHVNRALEAMRPDTTETARVYAAYGITSHPFGKWEIDHVDAVEALGLVPALAGDPTRNLFPELNDIPDPAMIRKYHLHASYVHNSKDVLEDVLHQKVCAGTVPLAVAQQALAQNWVDAYAQYVGPIGAARYP